MARERVDPLVTAVAAVLKAGDIWEKSEASARCGGCGARARSPEAIHLAATIADWRSAMDARRARDKFDAEAPTRKRVRPVK